MLAMICLGKFDILVDAMSKEQVNLGSRGVSDKAKSRSTWL